MRRLKVALLFVLMLCLVTGALVACNTTTNSGSNIPTIPTPPDSSVEATPDIVSAAEAYAIFKEAALKSSEGQDGYINADALLYLDYIRDRNNKSFALRFQMAIDPANDANSEMRMELWRAELDGTLSKMLIGFYYFDSTIVYDCTGIKKGATAVKTDDIDMTAIISTLSDAFGSFDFSELLLDKLLGIDVGDLISQLAGLNLDLGSLESIFIALMGESRVYTLADGSQRLEIPMAIPTLLWTLITGLFAPGGLIPTNIVTLVNDVIGIDLNMLAALVPESVSLYLVSEIKNDRLLSSSFDVGMAFDTTGTALEGSYGIIQSQLDLSLGARTINYGTPVINNALYLTDAKAPEGEPESAGGRGLDITSLGEYSLLTFDLTIGLDVLLKQGTHTVDSIVGAFGTLISGLIPGYSELPEALKTKEIVFDDLNQGLNITVKGGLNMRDSAQTNLVVELTGQQGQVRARIAYVGADQALYVDLSGILGTGMFKVTGLNLNAVLGDLIDQLITTIKDGISGLSASEQEAVADYVARAEQAIAEGDIVRGVTADDNGAAIQDTIGLIVAIINNIDVNMDGNIFNIQGVTVTLTQSILDYIFGLVFTGDNAGAKIPIVGDVKLEYTNDGFGALKNFDLGVNLGVDNTTVAGLGVNIAAQFGSVRDSELFDQTIADCRAANEAGKYIPLVGFDELRAVLADLDNADISTLFKNVDTIGFGLEIGVNISADASKLADIKYDNGTDLILTVMAAFTEAFGADATLVIQAELGGLGDLIAGSGSVASLITSSNFHIALEVSDGSAPLELWLMQGVLYIKTDEALLGGMAVKMDIGPMLAGLFPEQPAGSQAVSAAEENSSIDVMGLLIAALAGVRIGDTYIDVYLATGLISQLFALLDAKGLTIEGADGGDLTIDDGSGISITLKDGLNLTELELEVALGVGDVFDMGVSIGGINCAVNDINYITAPDEEQFSDFFANPYVYLSLGAGIGGQINAGEIKLPEDFGSIEVGENITLDYGLSLKAKVDLAPILADFLGQTLPADYVNGTELSLVLDDGTSPRIAIYYKDGKLYVDANALGIAPVALDVDIVSLIMSLLADSDSGNEGAGVTTAEAVSPDSDAGKATDKNALLFALQITSKGMTIELVQGLTELLVNLVGISLPEISAMIAVDWTQIGVTDTDGKLLDVNVGIGEDANLNIYIDAIGVALAQKAAQQVVISEETAAQFGGYATIGAVSEDENGNIAFVLQESVYLSIQGAINLSALADAENEMTVGEWISAFLEDTQISQDPAVNAQIKSLIAQIVLKFGIDRNVSTSISFRIAANIRFNAANIADINYILSHSDIALEIYDGAITDGSTPLLAVYLVGGENGSNVYISSAEDGLLNNFKLKIPNLDLATLLASSDSEDTPAATTADEVVVEEGTDSNVLDIIQNIIGNVIYGIYMDNSTAKINLGAQFVTFILNTFVTNEDGSPAITLPDNFVELVPENSFVSLWYGDGPFKIQLSLGVNPFIVGIELSDLQVGFGDEHSVLPDNFAEQEYKSIYDGLEWLSVSTNVELDVKLGNTDNFENNELPIGDLISALVGNLEFALGLEISNDLRLDANVYVGANINLINPTETEIVLQLTDRLDNDKDILGIYLRGSQIWVTGVLFSNPFTIENTAFAALISQTIADLLAGNKDDDQPAEGSSSATTAADEGQAADPLEVLFNISENHLSLIITKELLTTLISALAGDSAAEISKIIETLNPNAELDIDFSAPSLNLDVDAGFVGLGLSIVKPSVGMSKNEDISNVIKNATEEADGTLKDFNSYKQSSVVRFDITLNVSYSASATYQELSDKEANKYPASERHIRLSDGTYVQNPTGTWVRQPLNLSQLVGEILNMQSIKDAIGGLEPGDLNVLVTTLLNALGLDLALNDPIDDNFDIILTGALDLSAINFDALLAGNFSDGVFDNLDIITILRDALQLGIQFVFNPDSAREAMLALYLSDGILYADLQGDGGAASLGGPKIKLNLIEMLDKLGVFDPDPETPAGTEAVSAEEQSGEAGEEGIDAQSLLDIVTALVRKLALSSSIITGTPDDAQNILTGGLALSAYFNTNLIAAVAALITGNESVDFDSYDLDEASRLYIDLSNGGLSLGVEVIAATGFTVNVEAKSGIELDFATENASVVGEQEKNGYVDLTQYIYGILKLMGNEDFVDYDTDLLQGQRITVGLGGILYFESTASDSYNLGSLVSSWIEDLVLELKTQSAFYDGVGFRVSLAADPTKLAIDALLGDTPDFVKFLTGSDLMTIELALELMELDAQGNVVYDENGEEKVLGGIYLYRGDLYLDGTDIFDIVGNYSYVPNFLQFVLEAAQLGQDATGGAASASDSAVSVADGDADAARNAMISLVYSSTTFQIVITKAIVSLVLATLVPDLGGISDIFDTLQLSLDVDLGKYNYKDISAELDDFDSYPAGHRYTSYENEKFALASEYGVQGDYIKLVEKVDGSDLYLTADDYLFYVKDGQSYNIATSIEEGKTYYIRYNDRYYEIENDRYVRLYGYVQDDNGTLFREFDPYTRLREYYLGVNINIDAIDIGLKLGGLDLAFGNNQLLPEYILKGVDKHDPDVKVPLLPFYDSVVTVGASVEFNLGITEGKINFGEMLSFLLGDIGDIVVEMPATAKGSSSAHFRIDASVMLDMNEITNSEIVLRVFNLSSEVGAEVQWLAAYYMRDMLYLDLSFFGLPKLAVKLTMISEYLDDLLGDLLDGSIYDDVEIPSASASEAVSADETVSTADNLTTEEKVAQLLISNRRLAISIGNAVLRYALSLVKLGDYELGDFIYDDLLGSLDVAIDLNDGVSVEIGAHLELEGERYLPVTSDQIVEGGNYYVFFADAAGMYTPADEGYRAMGTTDIAEGYARYARYEVVDKGDNNYVYVDAEGQEQAITNEVVYAWQAGTQANPQAHDMKLDLMLAVNNLDVYFTSQREYTLTVEELNEYKYFNDIDNIKLNETISLDLLFDHDAEVDLTPLLNYLFPDATQELKAAINSMSNNDGDVERKIDLSVSIEFRLGGFIQLMRQLGSNIPDFEIPEGDLDLIGFIQLLSAIIDNENVAADLGLEMLLDYINASIEIITYDPDFEGGGAHRILGVYLISGEDDSEFLPNENGIKGSNNGLFIDLSYFGQPGIQIKIDELKTFIDDLMGDSSAEGAVSEAVAADEDDGGLSLPIQVDVDLDLPLISSEIAAYIGAFLYGIQITSSYIRLLTQADIINNLLFLLTGAQIDLGEQNNQSYVTINTDFNNYRFVTVANAEHNQIDYANTRFTIEEVADGLYYQPSAGEFTLWTEDAGAVTRYNIVTLDTYIKVDDAYVSSADANRTDWIRAERYTGSDIDALNDTYVFYVKDAEGDTYSKLGTDVYVIYATDTRKPVIEIGLYLWEYKIGLAIQLPTTDAAHYEYISVADGEGSYVANPMYQFTPDATAVANDNAYLYYRGEFYPIVNSNAYTYNGTYNKVDAVGAYDGTYYLLVNVVDKNYTVYVPITEDRVYRGDKLSHESYINVGEGNGNYDVKEAESLISKPDYFVNYKGAIDAEAYNAVDSTLYLDPATLEIVTKAVYEDRYGANTAVSAEAFDKAEVYFVRVGNNFVSVKEYGELTDEKVYPSNKIKYVDTEELYSISLTLRGSLKLGQYALYLTADEWMEKTGSSTLPADKYAFVDGHYVLDANGTYYRYTASSAEMDQVLGGVLGELNANFNVANNYSAEILFEIRLNATLDYSSDDTIKSLYFKNVGLAIDAWRREQTDGTLTHIIGLYYENDPDSGAALYADLTWLLGSGAKFKIDLSAYSIEDLLADKLDLGEILGGLTSSESDEATTASDARSGGVNVGDPSGAYGLLNFYTRSLALKASAGFIKLIVNMVAPNTGAAFEEYLPNIVINAQIDLDPYDITIGATLFDETGEKGLLDIALTLNLFNNENPSQGMQIDFGSEEDFAALNEDRLASESKDYIYYYGMYTYVGEGNGSYAKDGTDKGYVNVGEGKGSYVKNTEVGKKLINQTSDYALSKRYALIPDGYRQIQVGDTVTDGTTVYYYRYYYTTERTEMAVFDAASYNGVPLAYTRGEGTVVTAIDGQYGKLYVRDDTAKGGYVLDGNGVYMDYTLFSDYVELLSLNLGDLLGGGSLDIFSMLGDIRTLELSFSLDISLKFSDIINWTEQLSKLMTLKDGVTNNYFKFLLASLARNQAEFMSYIGGTLKVYLQLNAEELIGALPTLTSGAELSVDAILPLLAGTKAYIEFYYDTNYHGDRIEEEEGGLNLAEAPLRIWLEITPELNANVYISGNKLGELIETGNATLGDFLGQNIYLEGLPIMTLIESLAKEESATEEQASDAAAADEPVVGAPSLGENDLGIDVGNANTGLLPEDVWGVFDMILGQVLFANDMLSVGLAQNLLENLIKNFVPDFNEESYGYLPLIKVTDGSDTSGINILFGGTPSIQVQVGFMSGMETVISKDEILANNENDRYIAEKLYGITDLDAYLATLPTVTKGVDGKYTAGGNDIVLSTSKYALVPYAASDVIWLGKRYNLVIDQDGNLAVDDVANPYANAWTENPSGLYGDVPEELTDYQGHNDTVTYATGTKMLVSQIELLMHRTDKNKNWTYSGTRYDLNPSAIEGQYLCLGDVNLALTIGDLGIRINDEFSAPDFQEFVTEEKPAVNVAEAKLRLSTNLDVSFYGEPGEAIDLSELLDIILGLIMKETGADIASSELVVNIIGELGNSKYPYCNVAIDAFIDVADLGNMQIKLSVKRYSTAGVLSDTNMLEVSLANDSVYVDLSGMLGEGVKVAITDLGLVALLEEKLSGVYDVIGAGSTSSDDASTATITDAIAMTLHEFAYLGVLINPGYFSMQLTTMVINSLIAKISEADPELATDVVLPDLGDIMLAAYGSSRDGARLSLNAKFAEDFTGSIDINEIVLGTKPIFDDSDTFADYKEFYNITTGKIANDIYISADASLQLSMTSKGLEAGNVLYDDSLAGWGIKLITDLLLGVLGENVSLFSESLQSYYSPVSKDDALNWVNGGGTVYFKTSAADGSETYEAVTDAASITDGVQYYKFTPGVDVVFAENDVNLLIDITADIDLGAIINYGIGGILFSDLKVDIRLGEPFNSQFLTLYYLGSSRLTKTGNIYTLGTNGTIFSDAIYIDASGLGLGKIKFQGITGLLGANIGSAFDNSAADNSDDSAATSADETPDGDKAETGDVIEGVSLAINIAEGSIGLELDSNLLGVVFGMLGDDIAGYLPPIQKLALNLALDDNGISQISLEAVVDKASTGLQLSISDIGLALEKRIAVEGIVGEVSIGYAGLTYSKTAGLMTLIQNVLDGLSPALALTLEKNTDFVSMTAENTYVYNQIAKYGNNGASAVTLTGVRKTSSIGNGVPDYHLVLDLSITHPDRGPGSGAFTAKVHFGNNNILIQDLDVANGTVNSLVGTILGDPINLASMVGGGSQLFSFAYSDADSAEWNYSSASTTPDFPGAVSASDDVTTDATSALEMSYEPKLDGLIQKITLNLFNSNGYQPYLSGMKTVSEFSDKDEDSKFLSIKIELGKDAYNELLIMVYTIVLNLIASFTDSRSSSSFFFPNPDSMGSYATSYYYFTGPWPASIWGTPIHDVSGGVLEFSNNIVKKNANGESLMTRLASYSTTQEKVNFLKPYVTDIPVALLQYVLYGGLLGVDDSLVGAATGAAGDSVGNLGIIIGSLLPLAFASYDPSVPNPSLNIYIDLSPNASDYRVSTTVTPGIQALELMVNVSKTAAGGKNVTNGTSSANGLNSFRDSMILTINPLSLLGNTDGNNKGLLGFVEADTATLVNNNGIVGDKTEIVISDPATRKGQITFDNGSTQEITLNGTSLAEVLPLTANVTFPNSQTSANGTTVVWDAASVDLTAAGVDATDGRRLAGYVYGYALNNVVAAIPVYITNDYAFSNIYSYADPDGDGTYTQSKLELDMTTAGKMQALPDLVRIKFLTGGTRTFATQLTDEEGNGLVAVLKKTDGSIEELTAKDAEGALIPNADGGKYKLYPAFTAAVIEGETIKDETNGLTYLVIDPNKLPTGRNFPVGVITWDTSTYKYGFDGAFDEEGNAGQTTLNIGFSYQWGYAATASATYPVTIKRAAISSVTRFANNDNTVTVKNFESFKGNTIDALIGDQSLFEYLSTTYTTVSGRYTSNKSFNGLDIDWESVDRTALNAAIKAITNADGKVEYWRGLDVTLTLYVGEYYVYRSLDSKTGNVVYGMMDAVGFVNANETVGAVTVRQPLNVRILIEATDPPVADNADLPDAVTDAPKAVAMNFNDGSEAYMGNEGYLEYTIESSAQLYGALPTTGTVVNAVTGEESFATFDWNGFKYDAEADVDTALLTVKSAAGNAEYPVMVTLAANGEVSDAINNVLGENSTSSASKINDPAYRTIIVDPYKWASYAAFVATLPKTLEVTVSDGTTKTLSVNWGTVEWGNDAALPVEGYRNDDFAITFTDENGTVYNYTVPMIVIARTIADSEFVPDGYTFIGEVRRFSTIVRTYTNFDEGENGQVIEVSYDRDTGLPTAITFYNSFEYKEGAMFGKGNPFDSIVLTFAGSNASVEYDVSVKEDKVTLPADFSSNTTSETNVQLEIKNADLVVGTLNIGITFKAVRITRYNSTIAADDLVTLRYNFNAYESVTPFNSNGYKKDFVYFVDGKFVKYADYEAADSVYKQYAYKVLGGKDMYRYDYDESTRTYSLVKDGEYVFVYTAADTITVSRWDHAGLTYTYAGGVRNTSAVIKQSADTNEVSVSVPLNFENTTAKDIIFGADDFKESANVRKVTEGEGESAVVTRIAFATGGNFATDGTEGGYLNYFDIKTQTYHFDPFSGIKLSEEFFPKTATLVTADGKQIAGVGVKCDFATIGMDYQGGTYTLTIEVSPVEIGRNDAAAGKEETTLTIKKQTVRKAMAEVVSHNVTGLAEGKNTVITDLQKEIINPYDFSMVSFKNKLPDTLAVNYDNGNLQTYSEADASYKLEWKTSTMKVNYLGGIAELTALLTGPDGSTQEYAIEFNVYRVLVTKIEGIKGGTEGFTFGTEVGSTTFGVSNETHTINPYDAATQSLPKGYKVYFSKYTYADGTFAKVDGDYTTDYSYIAVAMPTTLNMTVDLAKTGGEGRAALQIGNGQRLSIKLSVPAVKLTDTTTSLKAGTTLTTKTTVNGYSVYVVWHGTATVKYNGDASEAKYYVTFASTEETYTIPKIADRSVEYNLTPYVGAVIDAAGRVLDTETVNVGTAESPRYITVPKAQIKGTASTVTV